MAHKMADLLERCFVVGALLVMTEALIPLITVGGGPSGRDMLEGDRAFQAAVGGVYVVTGFLALASFGRFMRVCRANLAMGLLVAIALASVLWSVNPEVTARRGVALVGTTLFAFYVVARFTPEQFLRLLAAALGLAAIGSVGFALLVSDWGVHGFGSHQGDWRGVFEHKNVLGRVMGLGTAVFLILAMRGERHRLVCWLGLGLCVMLVLLSGSRTAWMVMPLLLLGYPLLHVLRAHVTIAVPALLIGAVVTGVAATWFIDHSDAFFGLLGRDATLTGRTNLWMVAFHSGMEQPWLGHGYRAFWLGEAGASGDFPAVIGWDPGHGHNSFLDLWLDLGVLGIAAFGLTLVIYVGRAIVRLRRDGDASAAWYPLSLVYILAMSTSGILILAQNNFAWVIYVVTLGYLTAGSAVASRASAGVGAEAEYELEALPVGRGVTAGGRW